MLSVTSPGLARIIAILALASVVTAGATGCGDASPGGSSGQSSSGASEPTVPVSTPEIVAEHPWDSSSFTQGVEMAPDGTLVVGTGMYGESRIYRATLDTQQSDSQKLESEYFGEGITIHGNDVWQLTWKEGTAFRRDLETLKEKDTVNYKGEGWGLCSTGEQLVMSNGSGTLTFRDPENFAPTGTVDVTLGGDATSQLNELECADDGSVFANVWQTDLIYKIDPASGEVTEMIDTADAFPAADRPGADVLNGIAKIPGTDRYLLTGNYWDTAYEVRF